MPPRFSHISMCFLSGSPGTSTSVWPAICNTYDDVTVMNLPHTGSDWDDKECLHVSHTSQCASSQGLRVGLLVLLFDQPSVIPMMTSLWWTCKPHTGSDWDDKECLHVSHTSQCASSQGLRVGLLVLLFDQPSVIPMMTSLWWTCKPHTGSDWDDKECLHVSHTSQCASSQGLRVLVTLLLFDQPCRLQNGRHFIPASPRRVNWMATFRIILPP